MSTSTVSEPKALGMLTGLMAKVMHRLTPEERTVMIQEAGAIAQSELGKAFMIRKFPRISTNSGSFTMLISTTTVL